MEIRILKNLEQNFLMGTHFLPIMDSYDVLRSESLDYLLYNRTSYNFPKNRALNTQHLTSQQ
jgi:hypothetical protein